MFNNVMYFVSVLSAALCGSLRGRLERLVSQTDRCVIRWTCLTPAATTAELIVPLCPSVPSFCSTHYSLFPLLFSFSSPFLSSLRLALFPSVCVLFLRLFTHSFLWSHCPGFISCLMSPSLLLFFSLGLILMIFFFFFFKCCPSFCFDVASLVSTLLRAVNGIIFLLLHINWLNPNCLKVKIKRDDSTRSSYKLTEYSIYGAIGWMNTI